MPSPNPPPAHPARWRLLVAGLLLAVLAGWQGGHCVDGTMTTPTTSAAGHDHHAPAGVSACASVLPTVAATVFLLAAPRPAMGLWPAPSPQRITPPRMFAVRAPALASLGVLRI